MNVIATNFKYTGQLIPLIINNIEYIVIHHTGCVNATPEEIHEWHLQNGWNGFGYNEYIRKDGTVYIGRGDNIGAQAYGYNSISYGICCEGDFDVEQVFPEAMKESLKQRIIYNAGRMENVKYIVPHRNLYSTTCPGKNFPMGEIGDFFQEFEEFYKSINYLVSIGVINSPDYWLNNCYARKNVNGEYVQILIKKIVSKFKDLFKGNIS